MACNLKVIITVVIIFIVIQSITKDKLLKARVLKKVDLECIEFCVTGPVPISHMGMG